MTEKDSNYYKFKSHIVSRVIVFEKTLSRKSAISNTILFPGGTIYAVDKNTCSFKKMNFCEFESGYAVFYCNDAGKPYGYNGFELITTIDSHESLNYAHSSSCLYSSEILALDSLRLVHIPHMIGRLSKAVSSENKSWTKKKGIISELKKWKNKLRKMNKSNKNVTILDK